MTEPMYDPRAGLAFMRAIVALDDAEIERIQRATDPTVLVQSLGSVALMWGYQLHGDELEAVLDAHLLDQSIDPLVPNGDDDA